MKPVLTIVDTVPRRAEDAPPKDPFPYWIEGWGRLVEVDWDWVFGWVEAGAAEFLGGPKEWERFREEQAEVFSQLGLEL